MADTHMARVVGVSGMVGSRSNKFVGATRDPDVEKLVVVAALYHTRVGDRGMRMELESRSLQVEEPVGDVERQVP